MNRTVSLMIGAALVLGLAAPGAASAATTLGTTTVPAGSDSTACAGSLAIVQRADNPSHPYFVPGPGTITGWSTNTTDSLAGSAVTFLVLRPAGAVSYSVVGVDARVLPTPLPAGGVASFTLPTPIAVQANDTLGLFTNGSSAICFRDGGSVPAASILWSLGLTGPPAAGQTLFQLEEPSPPGFTLNAAATFEPAAKKKKCKKGKKKGKGKAGAAAKKKKKCKKKKGKK